MISKDEQIRTAIAEQAGDWFVENEEGPLEARESAALIAWLKASPIHVEEFLRMAVIARYLSDAAADPEQSVESLLARARAENDGPVQRLWPQVFAALRDIPVRRSQTAGVAMAALAVVSLGLLSWWILSLATRVSTPAAAAALHLETRHGEQRTHRLADGSVLHLNTDSSVTVNFTQAERFMTLTSGEADFEVARAPELPFRVVAGPAEAIAHGTEFNVRLRDDSAVVTVVQGRVTVEPASVADGLSNNSKLGPPSRFVELGPNQQITVPRGDWPIVPVAVDAERITSWLHRQISFNHEPLERVAAEFNRYAPKPIEITTPELRNLQVSGVFATDDPGAFIAFLRSLDGVRVDETATRIRVSKK